MGASTTCVSTSGMHPGFLKMSVFFDNNISKHHVTFKKPSWDMVEVEIHVLQVYTPSPSTNVQI